MIKGLILKWSGKHSQILPPKTIRTKKQTNLNNNFKISRNVFLDHQLRNTPEFLYLFPPNSEETGFLKNKMNV